MLKKMMLLALSVGALLAFAAPAARANVTLLEADLTPVTPGSGITFTSENMTVTIGGGNFLSCQGVEVHSTVVGEEETVTGALWLGDSAWGCTVNGVVPATVTEVRFDVRLSTGGEGAGTASFVLKFDVPLLGFNGCTNEGSFIPLDWTKGTDVIHVGGGPLLGTGEGCPAGAEEIHGTFTAETSDGTPVFLVG